MRISVIGWGSIVWDRQNLEIVADFEPTGPRLPIEFCRISRDGRLTLVIDEPFGTPCITYSALSSFGDLNAERRPVKNGSILVYTIGVGARKFSRVKIALTGGLKTFTVSQGAAPSCKTVAKSRCWYAANTSSGCETVKAADQWFIALFSASPIVCGRSLRLSSLRSVCNKRTDMSWSKIDSKNDIWRSSYEFRPFFLRGFAKEHPTIPKFEIVRFDRGRVAKAR